MEFRALLNELEGTLPEMALKCLPLSLSRETQRKLCALEVEEAGKILNRVIDQINRGSVETIDSLTQKALKSIKKQSSRAGKSAKISPYPGRSSENQ